MAQEQFNTRAAILPAAGTGRGRDVLPAFPATNAAVFVDTWIAPPRKQQQPARVEYGPQYNGVGECPF